MPAKHKLDIFKTLARISRKDPTFYANLSDEEKNSLQTLVVLRWLSGIQDPRQIYFLNELVNPFVFSLYKHKELLVHLMSCCTSGKAPRYYWNKAKSKKSTNTPNVVGVIKEYFNYSTIDAIATLPLLDDDTILGYAIDLGRQSDELKLVRKELKTRGQTNST